MVLIDPSDFGACSKCHLLHEVGVSKEFSRNVNHVSLALREDLAAISVPAPFKKLVVSRKTHLVGSGSVADPPYSCYVEVGDLKVFDGLSKRDLVLLTQLNLLSPVGPSAGDVEDINTLLCQDRGIAKSVFELPTLSWRKPINGGNLPDQWSRGWDVSSDSTNDLEAKASAVLKAATPFIGPFVRLQDRRCKLRPLVV